MLYKYLFINKSVNLSKAIPTTKGVETYFYMVSFCFSFLLFFFRGVGAEGRGAGRVAAEWEGEEVRTSA